MVSQTLDGPVVVIGGGLAAVSFVTALRTGGFAGEVTVVEAENEAPYDRPPLSKEFQREGDAQKVRLDLSRAPDVRWLLGEGASTLDTVQRNVTLNSGTILPYGTLVLATGARPRVLGGIASPAVPTFTLRTLDDARRIRNSLASGTRLLVVGGGVIGLELAASARDMGCEVLVAEAANRLMNRCCPSTLSDFIAQAHRDRGVDIRLDSQVSGIVGKSAMLSDGSERLVDVVVVGIGVVANDDLARAAGIACDDGIFVDGYGRTTCAGVRAIGDVTRQLNPVSGRFERVETWSNAQNQGAALARTLLGQAVEPFADVPWYWTEQYDLRVQVAGLAGGDEEVLRGTITPGGKFSLIQFKRGRVVGVASVNNPREFNALKRLLAQNKPVPKEALADPAADLRKLHA